MIDLRVLLNIALKFPHFPTFLCIVFNVIPFCKKKKMFAGQHTDLPFVFLYWPNTLPTLAKVGLPFCLQ